VPFKGTLADFIRVCAARSELFPIVRPWGIQLTKRERAGHVHLMTVPRGIEEIVKTLLTTTGQVSVASGRLVAVRDDPETIQRIQTDLVGLKPGSVFVGLVLARHAEASRLDVGAPVGASGTAVLGASGLDASALALNWAPQLSAGKSVNAFDVVCNGLVQTGQQFNFRRGQTLRVKEAIRYENGETVEGKIVEIPLGLTIVLDLDWSGSLGWQFTLETIVEDIQTETLAISGSVPVLKPRQLLATLRGRQLVQLYQLLGIKYDDQADAIDLWLVSLIPPTGAVNP